MKKVYVKDLKIGDKVVKFDRSWLETDFIKHKFVIKDQSTIEKIKKNDIKYVYIEPTIAPVKKIEKMFDGDNKEVIEEAEEVISDNLINIEDFSSASEIYVESVRIVISDQFTPRSLSTVRSVKLIPASERTVTSDQFIPRSLRTVKSV